MGTIIKEDIPAISIIVPVYNVEKYLIRCLDSIFNQKFEHTFEVIVVEDCSTDNSLLLLKEYKKTNPELIIIKQHTNQKLSVARKTGMDIAKGDYIMHVDSDDWLLPCALDNLYKKCKETNADVVVYNYVRQNESQKIEVKEIIDEIVTCDKLSVQKYFYGSPWNKIVKRTFTSDMICGEKSINSTEDLLYSTELLLRINSICLVPEVYYSYFLNNESITSTISPKDYLANQIIVLGQIDKIFRAHKANGLFIENVLNYFEKWIYLEFSKMHFWKGEKNIDNEYLISEFSKYAIMNIRRMKQIELSIDNKFICLLETKKRFGIKMAIGIILRSLKKYKQ